MAVAKSLTKERAYVLLEDRGKPADQQTRFYFRNLRTEEYGHVQDSIVSFSDGPDGARTMHVNTGTQTTLSLLYGLKRVENLFDEDGNAVQYPERGSREDKLKFLDMLTPEWKRELAEVINEHAALNGDEAGNSASQSGSQHRGAETAATTHDAPVD